jgi:hypothetical protein
MSKSTSAILNPATGGDARKEEAALPPDAPALSVDEEAKQRWGTCVHESCHAVAAAALGVGVLWLFELRTDWSIGQAQCEEASPFDRAVIAAAGEASEALLHDLPMPEQGGDFESAGDISISDALPDPDLIDLAECVVKDPERGPIETDFDVMKRWATRGEDSSQWHPRMERLRGLALFGLRRNIGIVQAVAADLFARRVLVRSRLTELLTNVR